MKISTLATNVNTIDTSNNIKNYNKNRFKKT